MRRLVKVWGALTLLVLLGVCAVNVLGTVRRVPPAPRLKPVIPTNAVMRQELRMAGVRQALETRRVRGTIGYLADIPAAELAANPRGMEEYFLTQFALVPWVLDAKTQGTGWLVANLHVASIHERAPLGFHVVEDCGGGVFLLRRTEPSAP